MLNYQRVTSDCNNNPSLHLICMWWYLIALEYVEISYGWCFECRFSNRSTRSVQYVLFESTFGIFKGWIPYNHQMSGSVQNPSLIPLNPGWFLLGSLYWIIIPCILDSIIHCNHQPTEVSRSHWVSGRQGVMATRRNAWSLATGVPARHWVPPGMLHIRIAEEVVVNPHMYVYT